MHVIRDRNIAAARGFSLIEVLVAIVVFSIGLLGVAATMAVSVRSTNTASLRTQATFLAESLADIMRAYDVAMWADSFDGTYDGSATVADCVGVSCTEAQVAARDAAAWGQTMAATLPNGRATVACAPTAPNPGGVFRRPYGGLCQLDITWSETSDAGAAGAVPRQFTWVFNP